LNEFQTDPAFHSESSVPVTCDAQGRPRVSITS
jgi:hypothetical protein